ncbi:hypothetical protein TNCV_3958531 [Trichonephila clavipes]|nr:hypothetical protein TNCV_3958531 [Trichonephila clavipes]
MEKKLYGRRRPVLHRLHMVTRNSAGTHEVLHRDSIQPVVQAGGQDLMIWGAFGWKGFGPLITIKAKRGRLATDNLILNHGQVTQTTPELALLSPNYHITPTGGRFSSRQI